jgi:hypothetical protein
MIVGVLLALLPLLLLVKPARGALLTPLLANRDHKPSGPARRGVYSLITPSAELNRVKQNQTEHGSRISADR